MTTQHSLYSQLPATDRLLRDPRLLPVVEKFGHVRTVEALRLLQAEARDFIRQQQALPQWDWFLEVEKRLAADTPPGLRPVFNLTGTVLHTNLGRALLAEE
ncbi:L-seryl-tRNA(Sec) selenium transferase, partial [Escherichia coli]|nr:L-seryl-tRNA(Sec) selenium transferase [Escherichia coli]